MASNTQTQLPVRSSAADRAAATRFGVDEAQSVAEKAAEKFVHGTSAYKRAIAETILQLRAFIAGA